jgi:hypothetical protein
MKKISTLKKILVIYFICCSGLRASFCQDGTDMIELFKLGSTHTSAVSIHGLNESFEEVVGSGALISDRIILTNTHVVASFMGGQGMCGLLIKKVRFLKLKLPENILTQAASICLKVQKMM